MAPNSSRTAGKGARNGRRKGSEPGNSGPTNMTGSVSLPPADNAGTPQAAADADSQGAVGGVDRVPASRRESHPGSPPQHAAVAGRSDEDAGGSRSHAERAVEESGGRGRAPASPSRLPQARPTPTYVGDLRVAELRRMEALGGGDRKTVADCTTRVAELKKAVSKRQEAAALGASLTATILKAMRKAKSENRQQDRAPKVKGKPAGKPRGAVEPKVEKNPKKRKAPASQRLGPDFGPRLSPVKQARRASPSVPVTTPAPAPAMAQFAGVVLPSQGGRHPILRLRSPHHRVPRVPLTRDTPASGSVLRARISRLGCSEPVPGLPTSGPQGQGALAADGRPARSRKSGGDPKEPDAMDLT